MVAERIFVQLESLCSRVLIGMWWAEGAADDVEEARGRNAGSRNWVAVKWSRSTADLETNWLPDFSCRARVKKLDFRLDAVIGLEDNSGRLPQPHRLKTAAAPESQE
jgi:hypothetical protein